MSGKGSKKDSHDEKVPKAGTDAFYVISNKIELARTSRIRVRERRRAWHAYNRNATKVN